MLDATESLRTGDVAKLCSVSPKTITNWVKAGRLEGWTTPTGYFRFAPAAVLAFLLAHGYANIPDALRRAAGQEVARDRPDSGRSAPQPGSPRVGRRCRRADDQEFGEPRNPRSCREAA